MSIDLILVFCLLLKPAPPPPHCAHGYPGPDGDWVSCSRTHQEVRRVAKALNRDRRAAGSTVAFILTEVNVADVLLLRALPEAPVA